MVSVILHGALGHMGAVVDEIVAADPDIQIVAGVDIACSDERSYPIYDSFDKCSEPADAIIDFSTAKAVNVLTAYAVERSIPLVLCTTGLSEEQIAMVQDASKEVAILRSANMSLGINLLMKLLKTAAATLTPAGYDAEIMEMHHRRKLDAPSGTALMLADAVNEGAGGDYEYVYDRSQRHEARPAKEIGVSAMRGGTVVGIHNVAFAGQDEVIEIKHTAYSRAVFAKGAVQGAKFLAGKGPGLYDMSDVID
ncbi:MAG: 4-hydroxy-tetrahydrodipicolinate reductase [Lachnospiraceae bacterium]|nr:4-hydroxy-tetrahydrodipicolinate reductase [Candidatus Equihabitans merdae]